MDVGFTEGSAPSEGTAGQPAGERVEFRGRIDSLHPGR